MAEEEAYAKIAEEAASAGTDGSKAAAKIAGAAPFAHTERKRADA